MISDPKKRYTHRRKFLPLVAVASLCALSAQPTRAQPADPPTAAAVWICRNDQQPMVRRNLNRTQLDQAVADMEKNGFQLTDIEPYHVLGQVKYAAVWRKGALKGQLLGPLSQDEFRRRSRNRRLIDLETYSQDGEQLFVGIWRRGRVSQRVELGLSAADFNRKRRSLEREGFLLTDFEVYRAAGTRLFAAVWRSARGRQEFVSADSWNTFDEKFHELGEDFALTDFEMVFEGGQDSYFGLWRRRTQDASQCGHGRRDHLWVGHDVDLLEERIDGLREAEKSLTLVDLEIADADLGLTSGTGSGAAPVAPAAGAAEGPANSITTPPPPPQGQRPGGPVHDGSSEGPPEEGEGG